MKCGHYHKGFVRRSAGQSAGNFCAYDMRRPLQASDGTEYRSNNTDMSDFVDGGMIIPDGMPGFDAPADIWASAEKFEKRKDAQLAARIDFALPNEFNTADIADAVNQIMQAVYPDRACTYAAHKSNNYGQDNLHVHMLVTLRPWDQEKQCWGKKYRPTSDRRQDLQMERSAYTSAVNQILDDRWREDGIPREYWTAMSYEDQYQQGIIPAPRVPSRHAGVKARPYQRKLQAQIVRTQQWVQDRAMKLVETMENNEPDLVPVAPVMKKTRVTKNPKKATKKATKPEEMVPENQTPIITPPPAMPVREQAEDIESEPEKKGRKR